VLGASKRISMQAHSLFEHTLTHSKKFMSVCWYSRILINLCQCVGVLQVKHQYNHKYSADQTPIHSQDHFVDRKLRATATTIEVYA
jgi:hypothetical protein